MFLEVKRMKRLLLCATLLLPLSAPVAAHAADAQQVDIQHAETQHLVVGVGLKHCKFHLNSKDPMAKPLVYSWVQGAITGIDNAMAAATGKELLINKVTSSDVIISVFDSVCRSNPTMTIEAAANETYGKLLKR